MIFTVAGWTGAAIVFTHASGAATYSASSDVLNPYEVAVALQAWLDDPARPWAAAITGVGLAVEDDGVRHRFRFTYTGPGPTVFVSIVPNATWIAVFGDPSLATPSACPSSCSATPGSGPWERRDTTPGERNRMRGWRVGHPLVSNRRPAVELAMSLEQSYVFDKALRLASAPRSAYLYDELAAAWRFVTVGASTTQHPEGDPTVVIGTLDVLGGV